MLERFKFMVSYDPHTNMWRGAVEGRRALASCHIGTSGGIPASHSYTANGTTRNSCFDDLISAVLHTPLGGMFVGHDWISAEAEIRAIQSRTDNCWFYVDLAFDKFGVINQWFHDVMPLLPSGMHSKDVIWEIASLSHPQPWAAQYPYFQVVCDQSSDPDLLDMVPF